MRATDDEIREKYLERAIRELNNLTRELQECQHCPRGNLMPVLGSGHPQADIFLLKYAPLVSEIEEGVAFYGRAGTALMKALKFIQTKSPAGRKSTGSGGADGDGARTTSRKTSRTAAKTRSGRKTPGSGNK